jgi:hypothetical protein
MWTKQLIQKWLQLKKGSDRWISSFWVWTIIRCDIWPRSVERSRDDYTMFMQNICNLLQIINISAYYCHYYIRTVINLFIFIACLGCLCSISVIIYNSSFLIYTERLHWSFGDFNSRGQRQLKIVLSWPRQKSSESNNFIYINKKADVMLSNPVKI